MTRLDAMMAREYEAGGEKKTAWTKIGAAFPARSGNGYTVTLDAMPAPINGQYKIVLMEPKPRDEQGGGYTKPAQNYGGQSAQAPGPHELDDEIPFITNGGIR